MTKRHDGVALFLRVQKLVDEHYTFAFRSGWRHRRGVRTARLRDEEEAEAQRKAQAPPPVDIWTVKLFNIDDYAVVYVNGESSADAAYHRGPGGRGGPPFGQPR